MKELDWVSEFEVGSGFVVRFCRGRGGKGWGWGAKGRGGGVQGEGVGGVRGRGVGGWRPACGDPPPCRQVSAPPVIVKFVFNSICFSNDTTNRHI